MTPRVLGLDIATKTGWAVDSAAQGPRPILGTIDVGSDYGYLGRSMVVWERHLLELLKFYRPKVIAYEAPIEQKRGEAATNSLTTSMKLLGMVTVVQMLGYKLGLHLHPCNIQVVRRDFVGNGHAKKAVVFDKCKMLGWKPADYEQSDAAAVWSYMHGYLKQRDIIARSK